MFHVSMFLNKHAADIVRFLHILIFSLANLEVSKICGHALTKTKTCNLRRSMHAYLQIDLS